MRGGRLVVHAAGAIMAVIVLGGGVTGVVPVTSAAILLAVLSALVGATVLEARAVHGGPLAAGTRQVARLLAFLQLVPLVDVAYRSRSLAPYSLAVLASGACVSAAAYALYPPGPPPRGDSSRGRLRLVVAMPVFTLAAAASWYAARALSTPVFPDTGTYWITLREMLSPAPGGLSIRTPVYPAVFALVDAAGGSGFTVLALQVGLRAFACAAVAAMLVRSSVWVGAALGVLLALDPVSAAMSVSYLTESFYTSGLLLSLALVISQLRRASSLRPWEAFGGGVCFGILFLIRPGGMAMIVPVAVAYLAVTRSLKTTGVTLGGFAAIFGTIALCNWMRTGILAVAATGLYVAFPLFSQHLFHPRNGPTSAAINAQLRSCDPDLKYKRVVWNTSNEYIHGKFTPCLMKGLDSASELHTLYGRAYREAILAHPALFAERMTLEAMRFFGASVPDYLSELSSFTVWVDPEQLCARNASLTGYRKDFAAFVCPLPVQNRERVAALGRVGSVTRLLYQPYLYAYPETAARELAGAAAGAFFLVAFFAVRAPYRPWVGGAAVTALCSAGVTAVGQVTMTRYLAVLSPLLLIVSGLFVASVVTDITGMAAVWRRRGAACDAALPTRGGSPCRRERVDRIGRSCNTLSG